MKNTVIIGAGITGLSVAYHLKTPYVILEKEDTPGGLCRSVKTGGCTFDYSGHFIHFHRDETFKLVNRLLKGKLAKVNRKAWIRTHGVYVPYPFQANLFALPAKIRKECLEGFINKPSHVSRLPSHSFYDWSLATFGAGITRYFMKPYNEKLWSVSSRVLTAAWVAPFVPRPTLKEVSDGASKDQGRSFGYNVSFYYPRKGGIQTLIDAFASRAGNIVAGSPAAKIDLKDKTVTTRDGKLFPYDNLVSTQPLPDLLDQMKGLPAAVAAARKKLKWASVYCLNVSFKAKKAGADAAGKHWVYFPESKYAFYRGGIYSNILKSMAPADTVSMYIEISRPSGRKLDRKKALRDVIKGLNASGLAENLNGFEAVEWMDMPCAYVVYDKYYPDAVKTIHAFLQSMGIYSVGRYGAWKYSFMEESIWEGKLLAEKLNSK